MKKSITTLKPLPIYILNKVSGGLTKTVETIDDDGKPVKTVIKTVIATPVFVFE